MGIDGMGERFVSIDNHISFCTNSIKYNEESVHIKHSIRNGFCRIVCVNESKIEIAGIGST